MSTIRVSNIQNASTSSGGIAIDTSGHVTVDGVAYPSAGSLSGRNRIINGDMRIDQRNAGASVTPTAGTYTLDRWYCAAPASSKYSIARSTTAPTVFTNSALITSLSAYTVGASESFNIQQVIEGFNGADLAFGTASAAAITVSFWVRSSLTGTFGGAIQNATSNRSYPFTYTISAANTFEYKTVTIPGDTSGTWATDNSGGITVIFSIGTGTTLSGTAGSWAGSNFKSATGATSVVGTNGATFYITGVQLEAGSVATPYERRSYGQELMLAQRYYWRGNYYGCGHADTTNLALAAVSLPATMRATPAVTNDSDSSGIVANGNLYNLTAASAQILNSAWNGHVGFVAVTTNSQITRWTTCYVRINNFQANAEL